MPDRPARSPSLRCAPLACADSWFSDHHCSHSIAIRGDAWPDDARLSEIEPDSFAPMRQAGRRRPAGFQLE